MSSGEAWVVLSNPMNPGGVVRHLLGEFGRLARCGVLPGAFREVDSHELDDYRPCLKCLPPEHDGPHGSADEAGAQMRAAAAAAARASLALGDLGYDRLAGSLAATSLGWFDAAERVEAG